MKQSSSIALKLMSFVLGCAMVVGLMGCISSPHLAKRSQMHMGTLVFLTAVASDEQVAQESIQRGFAEIHRLEEILSTWIPESELSRVNASAGRKAIAVSPETIDVLTKSIEMDRLTDGGFNIAIGPAVEAWDVSREGRVPTQEELDTVRSLISLKNLQVDEVSGSVFLRVAGMRVDIGGIGKGYAADLAATVMEQAGATAGVVAISGDIKTFGRMPDGQRFVFGIQHPRKEGALLGQLELEDEAVSTAGDYQRFFMKNGIRYHHILDPKTLQPARLSQSVTVVAQEGIIADGLDTGIFVMGPEKGMALIESLDGVEGVIVRKDGEIYTSSGLKERLLLSDR